MSFLLWYGSGPNDALDLGSALIVWKSFAEMARISDDTSAWSYLFSVPQFAEQDVDPEWLSQVEEEAGRFLDDHQKEIGANTRSILEILASRGGEKQISLKGRKSLLPTPEVVEKVKAKGEKVGRDAFLYMEPGGASEDFAQCSTCRFWCGPDYNRCAVLGSTKVTGTMSCGVYLQGLPHPQETVASATPEEVGLVDRMVRCENCAASLDNGTTCHLYQTLDQDHPELFSLGSRVKPKACCNANQPREVGQRSKVLSYLNETSGGSLVRPPRVGRKSLPPPRARTSPLGEREDSTNLLAEIIASLFDERELREIAKELNVGEKSLRYLVKGIVKKQDKIGRNICYDDQTGKRVACGGGSSQTGKQGEQKKATPKKEKVKKPTVEEAEQKINEIMGGGGNSIDKAVGILSFIGNMTVAELTNLKKKRGIKASGVKAELALKITQKIMAQKPGKLGVGTEGEQEESNDEESGAEREGSAESANGPGGSATGEQAGGDGGQVAGEAEGPAAQTGDQGGESTGEPAGTATPHRIPAQVQQVNQRLDRYEKHFRAKGNGKVADWMGLLREHINSVGVEQALEELGPEVKGSGEEVQYGGHNLEENGDADFIARYLDRAGISLIQGTAPEGEKRAVSTVTPSSDAEGLHSRGNTNDFFPTLQTLKNKLHEAQHLPGLEKSEDLGKLMGGELGGKVPSLNEKVLAKLNETYGEGKWIVKSYGDEAYAGYGIFFPQRAAQIRQDAQSAIWTAGEHLAKYGFRIGRGKNGEALGIIHESGDVYEFGSPEYDSTIHGDARHWADKVQQASKDELGASLPEGSFMAQPAFPVVGITNEERAQGITFKKGQEGRVHIVTRNGKAEIIPHSTWLKQEPLPVVFESEDTRAMAQAALDAINALPESERKNQLYAPDIVKTADGYRVVEANPANEAGASGYLQDNPMVIDSYVSHLTGREPSHVKFIRQLLTSRKKVKSIPRYRHKSVGYSPFFLRKSLFTSLIKSGGYFENCERDEHGHCLPKGSAGGGGDPNKNKKPKVTTEHLKDKLLKGKSFTGEELGLFSTVLAGIHTPLLEKLLDKVTGKLPDKIHGTKKQVFIDALLEHAKGKSPGVAPVAPTTTIDPKAIKNKIAKGQTLTEEELEAVPTALQSATTYDLGKLAEKVTGKTPVVPPGGNKKEVYLQAVLTHISKGKKTPTPPKVVPKPPKEDDTLATGTDPKTIPAAPDPTAPPPKVKVDPKVAAEVLNKVKKHATIGKLTDEELAATPGVLHDLPTGELTNIAKGLGVPTDGMDKTAMVLSIMSKAVYWINTHKEIKGITAPTTGATKTSGGVKATPAPTPVIPPTIPPSSPGVGSPSPSALTPPDPLFTGIDALGRQWVNGKLVKKAEEFPTAISSFSFEGALGGSTGAEKVKDSKGNFYVKKKGNSPGHLLEETHSDALYQAAGFAVPSFKVYNTPDGPVKIAKWVNGDDLKTYLGKHPDQKEKIYKEIQKGFVMDAFMGNWDVVGMSFDNIRVGSDGTVYRIDNGGSLRYRAQGKLKTWSQWNGTVVEMETLRNPYINPQTAEVFGGLTDEEIQQQVKDILAKKDAILAAAPDDPVVKNVLAERLQYLESKYATSLGELKKVPGSIYTGGTNWYDYPPDASKVYSAPPDDVADHPLFHQYTDDEARKSISKDEMPKDFVKYQQKIFDSLPENERDAISAYTGSWYHMVNPLMRQCPEDLNCLGDQKADVETALRGIAKFGLLKEPITVWRKMEITGGDGEKFDAVMQYALKSGENMSMPNFKSTSTSLSGWGGNVLVEIRARSGCYARLVTQASTREEEWLQGHNVQYKVVGIKTIKIKDKERKVYQVEEVVGP